MADITSQAPTFVTRFNPVKALWNGMVAIGEKNDRLRKIEALQNLSDKELAARGLKREDIARVVFQDYLWI